MTISRLLALLSVSAAVAAGSPALAQPGWGEPGWRRGPAEDTAARQGDDREGRISVERFPAEGTAPRMDKGRLGHGAIAVAPATPASQAATLTDSGEQAVYEAAVIDRLVKAGYETRAPAAGPDGAAPPGGQVVSVTVLHEELTPPEEKHKPVSGAMEMGVSNRGSMMGLAINIDMTKPKGALVQTRLAVQIRDDAGNPLWEGRALIATREGDARWGRQQVAAKLAEALFKGFPGGRD